jgi:hypothetical protein
MPRGVPKVYHSDSEDSLSEETDFGDSYGSDSEEGWIKKKKPKIKSAVTKRKPVAKNPRKITKKKKVLKRKAVKPKKSAPKKPTSPFYIYRATVASSVKALNTNATATEVTKIISTMWNALSIIEREPYKMASDQDKVRYERELAIYTPSDDEDDEDEEEDDEEDSFQHEDEEEDDFEDGSDDYQGRELDDRRSNRRAAPKKKAKKEKKPGPKRPSNAYLIFVNAKRAEVIAHNPTWPITEVVRHLGAVWKGMSDNDKKVYNELANRDKIRYANELKQFGSQ